MDDLQVAGAVVLGVLRCPPALADAVVSAGFRLLPSLPKASRSEIVDSSHTGTGTGNTTNSEYSDSDSKAAAVLPTPSQQKRPQTRVHVGTVRLPDVSLSLLQYYYHSGDCA
jgi:hypothetical protein